MRNSCASAHSIGGGRRAAEARDEDRIEPVLENDGLHVSHIGVSPRDFSRVGRVAKTYESLHIL